MMPSLSGQLTADGLQRLQEELNQLQQRHRPRLLTNIRRATHLLPPDQRLGELANLEHDLSLAEGRISELQEVLAQAQPLDPTPNPTMVTLGTPVLVRFEDGGEETLTVVEPLEADPRRGRIAKSAPAAQALLGQRAGAQVTVGSGKSALKLTVVRLGSRDGATQSSASTTAVR